jgi:hypothetical protein
MSQELGSSPPGKTQMWVEAADTVGVVACLCAKPGSDSDHQRQQPDCCNQSGFLPK